MSPTARTSQAISQCLSCNRRRAAPYTPLQPWMQKIRREDRECAQVECGVKVLVFFEDERSSNNAVDGLEVEREVHGVSC